MAGQLTLIVFAALTANGVLSSSYEDKITGVLLNSTRYTKRFRPVLDHRDSIEVMHSLMVKQLVKVDEKGQVMITDVRIKMEWNDQLLKWNPVDFGGTRQVNVNSALLWTPKLIVYNSADDDQSQDWSQYKAVVTSDGNVTWVVPAVIHSSCAINVKYFPFDEQRCMLTFGSWNFDVTKMNLRSTNAHALIRDYVPNGEWELLAAPATRKQVSHFCCKTGVSEVTYSFHLRRRRLFYVTNFIMPCALISVLNTLLFLMPEDTGERMAVGITILLSLVVFFLMVEEKLPISEDLPLIGKYYCVTIIEVSLCLVAMCVVLVFVHQQPTPLPPWIEKYILGYMARAVFYETGISKETSASTEIQSQKLSKSPSGDHLATSENDASLGEQIAKKQAAKKTTQPSAESKAVRIMVDNIRDEEKEEEMRAKWLLAANVINRFFLVLFTFSVVVTLLAVFGAV